MGAGFFNSAGVDGAEILRQNLLCLGKIVEMSSSPMSSLANSFTEVPEEHVASELVGSSEDINSPARPSLICSGNNDDSRAGSELG